ncbi:hypothetical protein HKCCE2091_10340 [Rhodobacterales bacterium HKCCE2091]|nr:hypothetical protein [Rhodobacterales bacterium HKCCE2091]
MRLACLVTAFLAGPVAAQVELGSYHVFDTRFGQVQVVGGDIDNYLAFEGELRNDLWGARLAILAGYGMEGESHDWLLVRVETGGNGCYPVHQVVRVSAAGLAASDAFGTCTSQVLDVRVLPGLIELDMSNPDATVPMITYRFDGAVLASTEHAVTGRPDPAGAGEDVLRWLGQHPHALFDDLAERARLETVMTAEEVSDLSDHVFVSDAAFRHGDWVIGKGCMAHQCHVTFGMWAIRIADGAVGAAIIGRDGTERLWGHAATDETLRLYVEANRP